jgi:protein-tyrosine phosphatase
VIDTHIHLLPAVDDGAATMAVSQEMLERARSTGFRTLVATPHLQGRLTSEDEQRISAALADVRAAAQAVDITVLLGYEIMLSPDLPRRLAEGEPVTLAGSHAVLVELPFTEWPPLAERILFELQLAGYRPVLAHPERYEAIRRQPEVALRLAERGILLQLTIGSVGGLFGRQVQRTAETLIRAGAVELVATDAHSAGQRFSAVPRGLERLRAFVGPERLAQLTDDVPRALLADAPLPEPAPVSPGSPAANWRASLTERLRRSAPR